MLFVASPNAFHGANAYHGAHRLSLKGVATVLAIHGAALAALASLDVLPVPQPLASLMVQVLPTAAPPAPPRTPPRPLPVERKPLPARTPMPQPPTLAAPALASSVATEVPVEKAPSSPAVAPALAPAATAAPSAPAMPAVPVQQPRFDANYLQNPAPVYPALARRLGEEGRVQLRVLVEPNGQPSQIELKSSSGSARLDQAAQDAVWRWKFIPARRGDEAVAAWVLVPIVFNLKG